MRVEIGVTDDVTACQAIRFVVFCEEQGVALADEQDGRDADAVHLLARLNGTPVGAARILLSGDAAKIGRVCVLPQHRGQGLGEGLIRAALAYLQQRPGITRAELGAQVHALGFYNGLGFRAVGPEYEEIGTPHRRMEQPL